MIIKNRMIHFLIIITSIFLVDFISFDIAKSAENPQIIIDENLEPGMALKDAIALLGPPESIKVSDVGTVVMAYSALGLSIEVLGDGTIIEAIHLQPNFRGRFASGIEIGTESQKILSAYNQPDAMTEDIIEYSDLARKFQIHQGRLVGADLYSEKSTLYRKVSSKKTVEIEDKKTVKYENEEVEAYEDEEAIKPEDEEVIKPEEEEAIKPEEEEAKEYDDASVFELYGFKIKNRLGGVIITEIKPGSVAEEGGLKVGEPIRKAFYKGHAVLNIYTVKGLKAILNRAIDKNKKTINLLQSDNHYYVVNVPKRK